MGDDFEIDDDKTNGMKVDSEQNIPGHIEVKVFNMDVDTPKPTHQAEEEVNNAPQSKPELTKEGKKRELTDENATEDKNQYSQHIDMLKA